MPALKPRLSGKSEPLLKESDFPEHQNHCPAGKRHDEEKENGVLPHLEGKRRCDLDVPCPDNALYLKDEAENKDAKARREAFGKARLLVEDV